MIDRISYEEWKLLEGNEGKGMYQYFIENQPRPYTEFNLEQFKQAMRELFEIKTKREDDGE